MILVASQRGGAKQLGLHLLRTDENEHVEVHEISGFVSEGVVEALKEAQAVAKGTRCKQYLFSVSLNPPETERVDIDVFQNALSRIEGANGLTGQPRVVVFHEKEGRRHCHAVWSRIDAQTMTAKPLPYFKNKLRDLGRELYLEHGWKMPHGFMNSREADPRNFSLAEWQQAKRMGRNARDLKEAIQDCWAVSDSRASFAAALRERGLYLARGDRRGFVAIPVEGEPLAIARSTRQRAKVIAERLGDPQDLPSVEETRRKIARDLTPVVRGYLEEAKTQARREARPLNAARRKLVERHRAARRELKARQMERGKLEAQERAARLRRGILGLWDRLTGRHIHTLERNAQEAEAAKRRDQAERKQVMESQLSERQRLQVKIRTMRVKHHELESAIHREVCDLEKRGAEPLREAFNRHSAKPTRHHAQSPTFEP
ncbi:MAG: relaxase/mobilization nuclease domain-containing protein [Alphaproteobacteria bacterium]|uniref:relaxase/mobilization nuclease domain-containing protein n=1 Tax=Maricaulis alexandrii TaxID=2570354 RepID=UPI001107CF1F|nr:relaxase [Maricaulis alexandrii]MCR9266256.1 relaxase/mobilization nuclease domain-containing protein [Alphaproteobacteria bacterium]